MSLSDSNHFNVVCLHFTYPYVVGSRLCHFFDLSEFFPNMASFYEADQF